MRVEWESVTLSTNRAYKRGRGKGLYLDPKQKAAREVMAWAVRKIINTEMFKAGNRSGRVYIPFPHVGPISVSVHIAPGKERGTTHYSVEVLPLPGELSPVLCDIGSPEKAILDVLEECGVYANDRQVVVYHATKEREGGAT